MIIVPPGGFAGFQQMTPASRAAMSAGMPRAQRKAKRKSTGLRMVRATKSRTGKAAKKRYNRNKRALKFGSPAWQAKYGNKKRRKKK